jgi:hypothetical protein
MGSSICNRDLTAGAVGLLQGMGANELLVLMLLLQQLSRGLERPL